ncbi:MAG: hypothetical protein NUW21_15090 [Elusimicrobia bacterium]|nr:hypothetical protein [Elusimicrobiota bacterium]
MTAKVKSALTVVSEALETAAGFALVAVGLYAVLFVDMTGGGSLWQTLRHYQATAHEGFESPNATRVIKVPAQAVVEKVHEDRMLAVFDDAPPQTEVAAVYQAPEAAGRRPEAAFTDVPADPNSGKTWKRGLKGELRNFTIYGKGDQTTSASMTVGSAPPRDDDSPAYSAASAPGSAARAPTEAAARPGVGSRLSRGALAASETSRNVR